MEKNILAHKEALKTKASDAESVAAYAESPPAIQTPLEDGTLPASSGGSVGRKSMDQGESHDMGKGSVFSLCPSEEADTLCPCVTPIHAALHETNSRRNVGKKNSRKRRNRKEKNTPWPLTFQIRASSATPVLGWSRAVEANAGVSMGHEKREQMRNGEKENISLLTNPCMELWPALCSVQPSSKKASVRANREIKVEQKSSHNEKNKMDENIMDSPWPLTVQAWASFTGPAKVQTPFAGASPHAINKVKVGHRSRNQKHEMDKSCDVTSYQNTQTGVPKSAVAVGQASVEGAPRTANSERNVWKKSRWNSRYRKKSDLAGPWPLTVQAWASLTTTGVVQALLQGESSAASMAVNVGQNRGPQLENRDKEKKSFLPWRVRVPAGAPFSATAYEQASCEEAPSFERHTLQGEPNQEEVCVLGGGGEEQVQSKSWNPIMVEDTREIPRGPGPLRTHNN